MGNFSIVRSCVFKSLVEISLVYPHASLVAPTLLRGGASCGTGENRLLTTYKVTIDCEVK